MPIAVIVLVSLIVFPGLVAATVFFRIRVKNKLMEKFLWDVRTHLRESGFEPVGENSLWTVT